MQRLTTSVFAFACSMLVAHTAAAHIQMQYPTPRYPDQKSGPCGKGAGDAPTANVNTFQAGETIVVRWTETIQHPGHFRISFDPVGQDDFGDPAAYDDFYSNPAVLVDEIADKVENQAMYEQEITFPEMSCDSCTLQLIQVMTDKPPYEVGTNDLYYQCADIVLMGAAETTGPDTTGDDTTGGTTGEGTTGSDTTGDDTTGGTTGSGGEVTTGGPTTGSDPTTGSATADATTDPTGSTGASAGNAGGDPDDSGCGCDSGGSRATGLAALVLLAVRRRRRS